MSETSLSLDIKPGDVIVIDSGLVKIELVQKTGKRARLRFVADRNTDIRLIKDDQCNENH